TGVSATLAFCILSVPASGAAAGEARLMLPDPPRLPPRYGIHAALTRWSATLQMHRGRDTSPPCSKVKPVSGTQSMADNAAPGPPVLQPGGSAPAGGPVVRPSSPHTEDSTPDPPALSAALVQRNLLTRSTQRLAADALSGAPERRELALRAVDLLWGL